MNQLTINGQRVNIGPTPDIIKQCGFQGPGDVRRAANRCSRGEPRMPMSDVVRWFDDHYQQPNV